MAPLAREPLAARVSVARAREGCEPVRGRSLQNSGAGADHLTPFSSKIARRTDLIEAPLGRWPLRCLREGALSGRLSGPVYVKDQPPLSTSLPHSSCCLPLLQERSGNKILLKESTSCLDGGRVKGVEKATACGTLWQSLASEQGQKRRCEGQSALVTRGEGRFSTQSRAAENSGTVDHLVVTETTTSKADV
jgi:hypothetical protein